MGINVYLSGAMQKFGKDEYEKSNKWRKDIVAYCRNYYFDKINFFNPNDYWNFKDEEQNTFSEREIMEYDLYRLKKSDILFVYINYLWSLGTMAEIAIAYELRKPIIIVNASGEELHSWQKEMANIVFEGTNWLPAVTYLADHYIF